MSDVKRYDHSGRMLEDTEADTFWYWVRRPDYDALRAELERLEKLDEAYAELVNDHCNTIVALKARLAEAARRLENIAWEIPAPNQYTPRLMELAILMRSNQK